MIQRLATIEREVEATIGGETFSVVERVGHVVRSHPINLLVAGQWVPNTEQSGEFIRMRLANKTYRWAGPLDDYDPDTNSHDPVADVRWEVE